MEGKCVKMCNTCECVCVCGGSSDGNSVLNCVLYM